MNTNLTSISEFLNDPSIDLLQTIQLGFSGFLYIIYVLVFSPSVQIGWYQTQRPNVTIFPSM